MILILQCDGSAEVSSRIGGWAFIACIYDKGLMKEVYKDSDYEFDTTNIRMELTAIIRALKAAWLLNNSDIYKIFLETDSEWAYKCLTYRQNCIKNLDLLDRARKLLSGLDISIELRPREMLKKVDKLAEEAMRNGQTEHAR